MNISQVESTLADLQTQLDILQCELNNQRQMEEEISKVQFSHTHAYYRRDRELWIARWNNTPYKAKHIGQFPDKQDAVMMAKEYSDLADFVLTSNQSI